MTTRINKVLRWYMVVSLFLSTSVLPIFSTPVSAQLPSTSSYYTSQGVETYDKSGTTQADCLSGDPGTGGGVPSGVTNAERVFKFLVAQGLTANQAAGIVGNMMQESGGGTFNLDPAITNPTSGAYGIAQWYADRKTNLINYANGVNKPVSDVEMQINFLWKELTTSYKERVLDPIRAAKDMRSATLIWLEYYEVPCMPGSCQGELNIRMPMAQEALKAFGSMAPGSSTGSSSCGDDTDAQVDATGYAFPVLLPKNKLFNWCKWPIQTSAPYCHHDQSPAVDISIIGDQQKAIGTSVVAIRGGTIRTFTASYNGSGCQSFQLVGDDGWWYWYGHIRSKMREGQKVSAGEKVGTIGESVCSAPNTAAPPHLHIDRGSPKGHYGGEVGARDPGFLVLINKLYAGLKN